MKAQISKSYLEDMKSIHANKPIALIRRALIIGAQDKNIGGVIADKFIEQTIFVRTPQIDEVDVLSLQKNFVDMSSESDILVLANGFTELNWFENLNHEVIQKTFDINVIGSLKAANLFVNATLEKPYKKYIVFIGSMAYKAVLNGSAAYCASKAALAQATRCLAWELAPKGFNVFCLHPSNTEGTPMSEKTVQELMKYRNLSREQAESYWGDNLPRAKWLQPEDIAEVAHFCVSGKADYMSGSNIELTGGQR